MTGIVDALGKPITPMPDDFCRNCRGRGYTAASIYEAGWSCECCTGTGWQGVRRAPAMPYADMGF